ncbi:NAD(P)-dependent oxidoreductase [Microbacterium sp. 22242]|uniref:NAD(P)-dependent oxidoreductase n=1 Tax=Microbacterium sp. 22242 TaxID=3453896 RepID=UPI003F87FBB4
MADDVGIVGLGPMGRPIAERLVDAGIPLTVWNRTAAVAAPFAARGAAVASDPAGAARPIVLAVLPDLPQLEQVLTGEEGLLRGWERSGTVRPLLVVHSTVSASGVRELADRARTEWGVDVVDAPLSGGTAGARDGRLSIMVGADEALFARLQPLFAHYGSTIERMGGIGSGSIAKACNQIVVASTVTAVAQALAVARASGLDDGRLVRILEGGLADSEVLRQKAGKWLHDDYAEGGSAKNQLKDLDFALDAAHQAGVDDTLVRAVHDLFSRMVAAGDGELDHTGIIRTLTAIA